MKQLPPGRRGLCLALALLLLCLGAAPLAAQDVPALTVDAAAVQGAISPYVLGANYGGYGILPPDQMETAAAAGIRFMRFPGGSIFDEDGRSVPNYLVDLFMLAVRQLNVEPSIQVKLFEGTPQEAADLVTYVNITKGYNVRYWYIGNEPNLYPDDYSVADLNAQWRPIAEAMLAVDPNIILIGPDLSQYPGTAAENPRDVNGTDWLEGFLEVNGDMVDIVAVHRYPFPRGNRSITRVDDLRNNAREWETIIPFLRAAVERSTGGTRPVAVTEINSHWSRVSEGEATPDSFYNAIWYADVLGRLIRQRVEIVTYFEFYGAEGRPLSLIDRYVVRPTYYTYQLYSRFGTTLVSATAPDDLVTIYAATREDGALTLMIVNLADDAQTRTLALTGFTPGGPAAVFRLDAEHNAASLGTTALDAGSLLTLPGQSVTLYILPPA